MIVASDHWLTAAVLGNAQESWIDSDALVGWELGYTSDSYPPSHGQRNELHCSLSATLPKVSNLEVLT